MIQKYIILTILFSSTFLHTAGIKGTVLSQEGTPVSDAEVRIMNTRHSDITDNTGHFTITGVPSGRYKLVVKHISYQPMILEDITLPEDGVTDMGDVWLAYGIFNSEQVVVTATRTEHKAIDLAQHVNSIRAPDLIERASKTSAEALREEPGLFVQKTNHGGGSAIIRGLSSNQILLLVDGIRLNNSVYRLGNHQYLTTVDFNMLDRIEVLRGPGSVQYGSDALGGVINLQTKKPAYSENGLRMNYHALGRFASADNEKTGRSEFSLQGSRLALLGGFSLKSFDDLRRGENSSNPLLEQSASPTQSPSGFSASDMDLKLIYSPGAQQEVIASWQKSAQYDVPRYDKYENNEAYRWIYTPQERELLYISYRKKGIIPYIDALKTTMSYHNQVEGRETQSAADALLVREKDDIRTLGFTTQLNTYLPGQLLTFGFDFYSDNVLSSRTQSDPLTGSVSADLRGRYPDNARYDQLGIYLQNELSLSENWFLTPGMRFSHHTARFTLPEESGDSGILSSVNQHFNSITGSLGMVYKFNTHLRMSALLSQGFRAPNLSDLSKLGESKGEVYEVPNPDLRPERTQNLDIGIRYSGRSMEAGFVIYYTQLSGLLASADATYMGRSRIEIAGRFFKIKSKQNSGRGFISGIEPYFRKQLSSRFSLRTHLTYTYGQNTTMNEPIGGIPPLFGLIGIQYIHKRFRSNSYMRFAHDQNRLSSDDRDDPRIPPEGTPGWYTFNTRVLLPLTSGMRLHAGIENILDFNYREHGSGINAPGRNIILTIEIFR